MTNDHDRPRTQFLRDEFAKAEQQDAEFFSAQHHINRRRMRRDYLRYVAADLIIAAAVVTLVIVFTIARGWI